MIRPTRTWRVAAVFAAATLVLTACGSDSDSDSKSKSDSGSKSAAKGDGTLTIGTLLPQTGDLASLGPPEFAGVQLAVNDINAAGGVDGKKIVKIDSDSGDGTPDIAGASVDKLLAQDADVIVGAASSNVSKSVIDKITGAGVVQVSPANTAAGFDDYPDKGLYFRTAPSDVLQGKVVANLAVQDGNKNVAVLARQDFYGEGLAKSAAKNLEAAGATVAANVLYNAEAENFTAEVNEVAAAKPDAIILVAFDETRKIIPQLIAKGMGPQDVKIYFVDGNLNDYSDEKFDLNGSKGTAPAPAKENPAFNKQIKAVNKDVTTTFTYSSEAYDTVVMSALAALAAGDDSGEAIASELIKVSKDGTQCSSWEECSKLVKDGEDIDYEGKSGPTDMNETGSLVKGTIGINQYDKSNTYKQIDSVTGLVE
jgi:ABC-type branched-subunit amino acid transport system substrate-binding protein